MKNLAKIVMALLSLGPSALCLAQSWPHNPSSTPLSDRIPPPEGFRRLALAPDSFGAWLRNLPLKPGQPPVHLYNGELKKRQDVHCAVVDLDVGSTDLQQCADAIIRLRGEYLWQAGRQKEISFLLADGEKMDWARWKNGERPRDSGFRLRWVKSAGEDGGYRNFEKYLRSVFVWANTVSLSRQLSPVKDPGEIVPGDVFVRGGDPGHAVLVMDVARDEKGSRVFLLAQSFMPAQEVEILVNPKGPPSPWYRADGNGQLATPEWVFDWAQLRRFLEP
jgi:hypothetical protein